MVSLASLDWIKWILKHSQLVKCEIESCLSDTEGHYFYSKHQEG